MEKSNRISLFFMILLMGGLVLIIMYRFSQPKSARIVVPNSGTPSITQETEQTIEQIMTQILSQKYKRASDTFTLVQDSDTGDYAKGSISFKEGGGGLWFAARVKGQWQLVYDGNGIIPCSSLLPYPDYPTSFIPQCFDSRNNMLIQR